MKLFQGILEFDGTKQIIKNRLKMVTKELVSSPLFAPAL